MSFHATKLFHTIEGGGLIINDDSLVEKARYLINFGIENTESIPELGTNAKMNEFKSTMGLCMLDEIEEVSQTRRVIHERYQQESDGVFQFQKQNQHSTQSYSYFPIILDEEETLKLQKALKAEQIFPRRYFCPSLDILSYIEPKQHCKYSRDISSRILALPMYSGVTEEEQQKIIDTIKADLK